MTGTTVVFLITIDLAFCNIALNKPAYGSSSYNPNWVPGYSVDAGDSTCFVTQHEDWDPWLVVDLLQTYLVDNVTVNVTSRKAKKAHDYKIELYEVNPARCQTSVGQLCIKQDGPLGASMTLVCDGAARGRFIKLSKYVMDSKYDNLHVCELEVSGKQAEGKHPIHRVSVTTPDTGWIQARYYAGTKGFELSQMSPGVPVSPRSLFECATFCATNQSCVGFNYRPTVGACQAIVRPTSDDTVQAVSSTNYYGFDLC